MMGTFKVKFFREGEKDAYINTTMCASSAEDIRKKYEPNTKMEITELSIPTLPYSGLDYSTLAELKKSEKEFKDWSIIAANRNSRVLIIAPHGRTIEPHTDHIAASIADLNYNLFIFSGLRRKVCDKFWLHVSSSDHNCYSDPQLRNLTELSYVAVSIHGCRDREATKIDNEPVPDKVTFISGGNAELMEDMWNSLESYGFRCFIAPKHLNASSDDNIVNRCKGKGVQLEISRSEREALADNPARLARYSYAIQSAIEPLYGNGRSV